MSCYRNAYLFTISVYRISCNWTRRRWSRHCLPCDQKGSILWSGLHLNILWNETIYCVSRMHSRHEWFKCNVLEADPVILWPMYGNLCTLRVPPQVVAAEVPDLVLVCVSLALLRDIVNLATNLRIEGFPFIHSCDASSFKFEIVSKMRRTGYVLPINAGVDWSNFYIIHANHVLMICVGWKPRYNSRRTCNITSPYSWWS